MAEIIKLDGSRPLDFDRETVEQAYDRWAPVYDLVFGGVFRLAQSLEQVSSVIFQTHRRSVIYR